MALMALVILGAAVVWLLLPRNDEPVYQGTKLSDWITSAQLLNRSRASPGDGQDVEAILLIGTNALPYLAKWIAYVPPRPRREPKLFGITIPFRTRDTKAELAQGSAIALRILGPRAAPALPDLVYLLKGTNVVVAYRAFTSICDIGIEGAPALLDYVTNRHAYSCGSKLEPINAMDNLGTNGVLVVPALLQCLNSQDSKAAGTAALLLANIGKQLGAAPQAAIVGALARATDFADKHIRHRAVFALGRLGPSAQSAVPMLVRALNDSDVWVRNAATNSLKKIAPQILETKDQEHSL